MASAERMFFWSELNKSIITNQMAFLKELNDIEYNRKKERLEPILNGRIVYSENDARLAYESGNITLEIMETERWKAISEDNPFTKTMRYWIEVQRERLGIATYLTFGLFVLGSALTGVGRAIEMRRANAR